MPLASATRDRWNISNGMKKEPEMGNEEHCAKKGYCQA